jgi:hypothetical protein
MTGKQQHIEVDNRQHLCDSILDSAAYFLWIAIVNAYSRDALEEAPCPVFMHDLTVVMLN